MDSLSMMNTWPPSIYIIDLSVWPCLDRILNDRHLNIKHIKVCSLGLQVLVNSTADFLRLSSSLRRSSTRFRTYHPSEVNTLHHVFIRYLPIEYDLELYHRDLVHQGVPVREVHRVIRSNGLPFNMVMAIVDDTPQGQAIFNVSTVSGIKVSVERPLNGICVRCGQLGHEEYYCGFPDFMLPSPSPYYEPSEPYVGSIAAPALALEASRSCLENAESTVLEISSITSSSHQSDHPQSDQPRPDQPPPEAATNVPRIDYESFFNLFEFIRSIDLKELDTVADKFRKCKKSLSEFLNIYEQHKTLLTNINEFLIDMESPY